MVEQRKSLPQAVPSSIYAIVSLITGSPGIPQLGVPIAEQLHSPKWKIEICLSLPLLLRVVELACSCDNSFECRLEGDERTLLPLKW